MNKGLYTAATALILNKRRMSVTTNNLANVNTNSFKKDVVVSESFPQLLLSKINSPTDIKNLKEFNGVKVEKDGNIYDLSIDSGYFRVKTPIGTSYNRELKFTIDENGYLRTFYRDKDDNLKTNGENYVLGKNGPIKVDSEEIEIDNNGNIYSSGKLIDNIVTFVPPNVLGATSAGVTLDRNYINFSQGDIVETGNNLDFALKGDGFFKVYTGDGIMYTRDGSFSLNDRGELVTSEGYFVIGQYGSIVLEGDNFSINENGEILQNGEVIDRLDIIDIENKESLRKQGNNLYKIADNAEAKEVAFNGQVIQGALESSNIDTIKEMVNMITLLRNYEASQKVIKMQDELLGKVANDLGKV
ncbi:flagellar hook-basal body protein [Thermohalobacter berrensis]|uniref:Flagellar biosynthesis protein FlgE n=1 Tax=Thermohalobacter berrensis TaxID=99594 RepID=A0A419T048_9FIRM|nr:flagellar hook-basal body protein [Thermohalobacter berrensis]RKD30924.1 flagellar biosynthesis protein FlgE [Thermohalobacter berrensis]